MSEVKGEKKKVTYRAAHVSQGLLGSAHSLLPRADGKRSHNVTAEFHRDATALRQSTGDESGTEPKLERLKVSSHHDQVHQGHRVQADAPQPHDAEHVDQDHGDGDADQHGGPQLEAQQHSRHHEYRGQGHAQVQSGVVGDGEVLLVEHVKHTEKEQNTFQSVIFSHIMISEKV